MKRSSSTIFAVGNCFTKSSREVQKYFLFMPHERTLIHTHEYTNKSHRSHCSNMANFPLLIHTFCPAAITTRPRVVLFTLATYLAIYSGMLGGCIHERVRLQ